MAIPAETPKPALNAIPGGKAPAAGPIPRKLKKGEILFNEGDSSRAMYLIKSGIIRIYKKKGDSFIELDTVHSGQILGELAFLDGNPRSASGEALVDCEIVEISGPTFQQVLTHLPDWLKILMKTIVGRLRAASTRIRQLESASSAYDYSDPDGRRNSHYIYLSQSDCMKISTALLLVGARNGKAEAHGTEIRVGLLQRYANQVMGVPVAKITSYLDVLSHCGVVGLGEDAAAGQVFLKDANLLEQLIGYMNEENLLEPSKRHDISPRGFYIMSLIVKHLSRYPADKTTGICNINIAEIRSLEAKPVEGAAPKDAFRVDEFQELVKLGYGGAMNIKSGSEILSPVNAAVFAQVARFQKIMMAIRDLNEHHRGKK
jgi:CRP-like cAMP-binding protein